MLRRRPQPERSPAPSASLMRIFDLWESAEAFQAFFEARILPAVQEAGMPGQPDVELIPVHPMFTPAFSPT